MKDITTKIGYDGVTNPAPPTAVHTAEEYNDRLVELQNSVENAGLLLAEADTNQLSKAMFVNGVAASSMIDSGSVNTIVLTPVGDLKLAVPLTPDYSALDGAVFSFFAKTTNSGNTTVNIGQTTGTPVGALPLFQEDGTSQIPSGWIIAGKYYSVRFDADLNSGNGAFVLLSWVKDVTATAPIASSGGHSPVISIADATTSVKGAVQLSNLYNGTSETKATTEKALSDATTMIPAITGPKSGYAGEESITFPNGVILKTGMSASISQDSSLAIAFSTAFPTGIKNICVLQQSAINISSTGAVTVSDVSVNGFTINNGGDATGAFFWQAWGY